MKNNLFTKKILDSDTLLSAVYKAREKAGVLNSSTEQSVLGSTRDHGDLTSNETTLKSRTDRVEDRLKDAESKFTPTTTLVNYGKTEPGKKIILVEDRNTVDEGYEERKEQERAKEAFERILRNKLYGEPLAEKPVPLDRGVYSIGEAVSAPLRSGGPLAKNGARTRGYTDTASDTGVPIQFTGGTFKEVERKYNDAMARQTDTMNEFNEYLENSYIDLSNLTAEQEDILDLVKKELTKKSVLGTLTDAEKNSVFDKTLRFLYSNTRSANGDPYPVFIDMISDDRKMIPELGTMQTDVVSEQCREAIENYGALHTNDPKQEEISAKMLLYKQQIYSEELENYQNALRNGTAKVGEYKEYYDRAMLKMYDACFKPIPITNNKGVVTSNIVIGALIAPYDDSLKAQAAMNALKLVGTNPKGLDCQGLVKLGYSEIDYELGKYGIGNKAEYQRNRTSKEVVWEKSITDSVPNLDDLQPGDLLYWENEQGETVHTAIYLEGGYMLEWSGTVRVTPLRIYTSYGDGTGSDLVQVNRPTEDMLYENVEKNTK